ncbi:MAG: hypothetical protein M0R22_10720 [Dehalococcoidia bacterium]|nr:hypothetical protein [Dehalococcoidia bacterium]
MRDAYRKALLSLDLPPTPLLGGYWAACVLSEVRMNAPATYDTIVVRSRSILVILQEATSSASLDTGARIYPPIVVTEGETEREARAMFGLTGGQLRDMLANNDYRASGTYLYLTDTHPFAAQLARRRGRPPVPRNPSGAMARYPDRLAVRCAMMHDRDRLTLVDIAKQLGLHVSCHYESEQSPTVAWLVKRGRRLVQ